MSKIKSDTNILDDYQVAFIDNIDGTTIVTSTEQIKEKMNRLLLSAMDRYDPENKMYSAYMLDKSNDETITPSYIDELAKTIHTDVKQAVNANGLIKKYIVTDDIIGKTFEALQTNVNTDIKLEYANFTDKKKKQNQLEKVKILINDFNKQIDLPNLIRESIPLTYANGTRILCLRADGNNYVVDSYPLGVAEISKYTKNGNPIVQVNINTLKERLKKTYLKSKKGNALFFKNIDEEIQMAYPDEVYQAYKGKEDYAILNDDYTGVLRINNLGLQYGVSPILRAIKSALMLESIENTDFINNKAKSKKIIHQIMRKEAMGKDFAELGFDKTVKAHNDLMQAWKQKTVVYTSIPQVEKIVYVEPTVEDTAAEKVNIYRSKEMTTLGIGFSDSNLSNFSVANISLDQLMKLVNCISQQLERVLEHWYYVILRDNGYGMEFVPKIHIIDAEQMNFEMKKELAKTLLSTFNSSYETAYNVLGISYEDELQKRMAENDNHIDEIFKPHASQYTSSSNNIEKEAGRNPSSENKDKQAKDKEYTENVRK